MAWWRSNYRTFFDTHIIPTWEQDLDVRLRDTSRASRIGQVIQAMSGDRIDARHVDHFVASIAASAGVLLMDVSDIGRPDRPIQGLLHSALGWSADPPAYAARDVQFVMDEARRTGTTSRPGIRRLQALLREHNKATTPAERNAAAERVRRHAAESRRWYEENAETLIQVLWSCLGLRCLQGEIATYRFGRVRHPPGELVRGENEKKHSHHRLLCTHLRRA